MKDFNDFIEEASNFPKYYRTSKNASVKKIADRYFKTGDKLYDVRWTDGEYHILANVKELEKIKEHDWSRKHSRIGPERYEELYQDIKQNGIKLPVQVMLYQYEGRAKLGEGNHRLAIAKELGIKKIPTVFVFWKGERPKEEDIELDSALDDMRKKKKFEKDMDDEDAEMKKLFKELGIKI